MFHPILLPVLPLLALLTLPSLSLQAQDAADTSKKIVEAYDNNRFEEAAKLAQAFIQATPQSPNLPSAYLLLARSQYNLTQWAPSIATYTKLLTLSKEKDVVEESAYYIIQAYSAQSSASPEKSAERNKSLTEALSRIPTFLKDYPESKSRGEIRLLQARLHIQESNFAEASKDLDAARTEDKEKELLEEIDYLQGYAEAQRARQLLADFKKSEGEAALARAAQIYSRIANGPNPALALEANLQLASIDLSAGRLPEAMIRLRAIPGRDELISLLEAKLAPLRAEITGQGTPAPEKLRRVQKAQQKIEEVRNRPDLSGQALFQLGQAFLQSRKYDEARLVFRQVVQYGPPDIAPTAEQQVILTFALQGRTSDADRLVADYQKKYPDQKGVAGLVDYLVGYALLDDAQYADAIKRLKSAQDKRGRSSLCRRNSALYRLRLSEKRARGRGHQILRIFSGRRESGEN